jgi:hypothetical protein
MKNYRSIRYAFVWCEQLASSDIEMGALDLSMQQLYRKYAAAARHLGGVVEFDQAVVSPARYAKSCEEPCTTHAAAMHGHHHLVGRSREGCRATSSTDRRSGVRGLLTPSC